eukprot:6697680-Alexandrium_andersonii.AAC.1
MAAPKHHASSYPPFDGTVKVRKSGNAGHYIWLEVRVCSLAMLGTTYGRQFGFDVWRCWALH